MKHFCYVTGTRAEFGLIKSTLQKANACPDLDISICVTGMHVLPEIGKLGQTIEEIRESGLRSIGCIETPSLAMRSGTGMMLGMSEQIPGMVELLKSSSFDGIIVLGDRGEMLVAALTAAHLKVPVIHIHGGERSGTIDESIRHAISKIAHYHFVSTENSKQRLIKMGEVEERIYVVGAPGLDDIISNTSPKSTAELCDEVNFNPLEKKVLAIYHPVLQEENFAFDQCQQIINALKEMKLQVVFLHPNTDAGSSGILDALNSVKSENFKIFEHLERNEYLSWLAAADVIVGNSSSAIIEAASFQTPAVDIGSRQKAREASENVIRVSNSQDDIMKGINKAFKIGKIPFHNIYGDGHSGEKIVNLLNSIEFNPKILNKLNAY